MRENLLSPFLATEQARQREIDQRVARVTWKIVQPAVNAGRLILRHQFEARGEVYSDFLDNRLGKDGETVVIPKLRTLWTPPDARQEPPATHSTDTRWEDSQGLLRELMMNRHGITLPDCASPRATAHGADHSAVISRSARWLRRLGVDDALALEKTATMPLDGSDPWLALYTMRAKNPTDHVRFFRADPKYYTNEYLDRWVASYAGHASEGAIWGHSQRNQTDPVVQEVMSREVDFMTHATEQDYSLAASTIIPRALAANAMMWAHVARERMQPAEGGSESYSIAGYDALASS